MDDNRHFETHKNRAQREIVIRYKPKNIKRFFNFLFILALLGVIGYQFYYPYCARCSDCGSAQLTVESSVADSVVNESLESEAELEEVEEVEEPEINETEVNESVVNETEEDEETSLPITDEVKLEIGKISVVKKGDDYARVMSVEFTIKNQLEDDLTPEVRAFLIHDLEDIKEVQLTEIDSGEQFTKVETKFTFGFIGIDTSKSVKVEVFNEKNKVVASATKSFSVS